MRGLLIPVLVLVASGTSPAQTPPEQPVPFSHKAHAGAQKLKCQMCHPNPDPGEAMSVAAPSVCMQCHSTIKADSAAIQKLAAAAKNKETLPWVRVYQIPSYVEFSHRPHVAAGNTCENCHGKVAERDRLAREGDLSMGGCMKCHQAKKVSIDCTFCHDQR